MLGEKIILKMEGQLAGGVLVPSRFAFPEVGMNSCSVGSGKAPRELMEFHEQRLRDQTIPAWNNLPEMSARAAQGGREHH